MQPQCGLLRLQHSPSNRKHDLCTGADRRYASASQLALLYSMLPPRCRQRQGTAGLSHCIDSLCVAPAGDVTAEEAFKEAINNLKAVCGVMKERMETALEKVQSRAPPEPRCHGDMSHQPCMRSKYRESWLSHLTRWQVAPCARGSEAGLDHCLPWLVVLTARKPSWRRGAISAKLESRRVL